MRTTPIIFAVAASLLIHSAVAQGAAVGGGTVSFAAQGAKSANSAKSAKSKKSAKSELQAQLDALAAQVQALEDSAPDSSVEGRTYCHVVENLNMEGRDPAGTERLRSNVTRRTTTFSGGSFSAFFLSRVRQTQDDNGTVSQFISPTGSTLTGTYVQTGNQVGCGVLWRASDDLVREQRRQCYLRNVDSPTAIWC